MTFHREGIPTLLVVLIFDTGLVWLASLFFPMWLLVLVCSAALILLGLILNFFRMPHRPVGEVTDFVESLTR